VTNDADQNTNPYQPPSSQVLVTHFVQGDFIPGGQHRPGGAGLEWIGRGWKQFTSAPGPWLGITVVYFILLVVISLVPGVSLLSAILDVILLGGLFLGCRASERGLPFTFGYLFAGFSEGLGRLAGVGAALAIVNVVFFVVIGGLFAATIGAFFLGGFQNLFAGRGSRMFMLVFLVYITLISMLGLFAPMLAVIYDQPVVESLKGSFTGCMRNLMSLTVFSLALIGLFLLCMMTLGLGLLVLIPVFWAALYHAARDIYEA
jgi:uncharacterized membrane protein